MKCPHFSFGLILRDIPNSITPQNNPPPATDSGQTARTPLYTPVQAPPPPPPHTLFCPDSSTCVRDRRALQKLALNVHVKHSDMTRVTFVGSVGWLLDTCSIITHTHTDTRTHTHRHAHTHTRMHTHTPTHVHTRTHTHACTHTHTHTHTHAPLMNV